MGLIAGQYTATYGGESVGQIKDGVRVRFTTAAEDVIGDNLAQTKQNGVYQGVSDFDVIFTLLEYNAAASQDLFWPYNATIFDAGTVGVLLSSKVKSLVMTAIAGTPAAAAPATATFANSILAPGFPVELLFAPAIREVPIQLRVYPNASGVFGTIT